jgi:hypothetical protein
MPLHLPDPPAGVPESVRSTLRTLAGQAKFSTEQLRNAQPEDLDVSTPHRIYSVGRDDILADRGLDSARPVGWRYLVEAGGQVIASAETVELEDGSQEVSQFTEGPYVGSTETVVRAARALPQLEKAGFELRLLRIPALYLMALWLHAKATDLLIPLAPSPIGKEGQIVPVAQLFSELSRQARAAARPERGEADKDHGPALP